MKIGKRLGIIIAAIIVIAGCAEYGVSGTEDQYVRGQEIVSKKLPKIRVRVSGDFQYLGKFPFKIRDVAAGERFVFAESQGKKVTRLFIAQFEAFYPENDKVYNYSFADAMEMKGHKFRQNTYAYSNRESLARNVNGEAALTYKFLTEKGLEVEDELVMSRFVTVPPENRKHELILFYLENGSETGYRLHDFYQNDQVTDIWKEISVGLTERSFEAFEVVQ